MQDRFNTAPGEPVRVVGRINSPQAHDLRVFLARNEVPYQWVDVDRDVLVRFLVGTAPQRRLPVVLLPDGTRLETPSRLELAERVGLHVRPAQAEYDMAILGAGPAGLTAAVYAASEGLRTIVIEREAPGGQAGTSSRIENYLGFPEGVSGQELTQRALRQAQRFGAEFLVVNEIAAVSTRHRDPFVLYLLDGTELRTRSAIVATGAAYRRLDAPRAGAHPGCPVHPSGPDPRRHPQHARRLRGLSEDRRHLGPPAPVPDVWPRRLLRRPTPGFTRGLASERPLCAVSRRGGRAGRCDSTRPTRAPVPVTAGRTPLIGACRDVRQCPYATRRMHQHRHHRWLRRTDQPTNQPRG
jgi:hypothetical protein